MVRGKNLTEEGDEDTGQFSNPEIWGAAGI